MPEKNISSEFEARAKRNIKDVHSEKVSIRALEDFSATGQDQKLWLRGSVSSCPMGSGRSGSVGWGGESGESNEVVEEVDDGARREEFCTTLAVVDSGDDAASRKRCRGYCRELQGRYAEHWPFLFTHPDYGLMTATCSREVTVSNTSEACAASRVRPVGQEDSARSRKRERDRFNNPPHAQVILES